MPQLDANLHAPARLKLMTMLTAVSEAEFSTIRDNLEVSDSVLSKHVGALASLGYVRSRKGVHGGRRTTWISLTAQGRAALSAHVAALREVIAGEHADLDRRTDLHDAADPIRNRLRELREARRWSPPDSCARPTCLPARAARARRRSRASSPKGSTASRDRRRAPTRPAMRA